MTGDNGRVTVLDPAIAARLKRTADGLENALVDRRCDAVGALLAEVAPHLVGVHVPANAAVDEDRYVGAYRALLKRRAVETTG